MERVYGPAEIDVKWSFVALCADFGCLMQPGSARVDGSNDLVPLT